MTHSIGVFDSNDDGSIESIVNKYSKSAVFYGDRDEISKKLSSLAKDPIISFRRSTKNGYSFLLIHQNDIDDLPDQVSKWIQSNRTKIILYSGGATGEAGVFQRTEIRRKLEDFILRVEANEADPLQAFRIQPLRSVLQWSHTYQHEFSNLYSPLDYLSLFYQGGDVTRDVYLELEAELQLKIRNTLATKKRSTEKWDAIFKRGEEAFNTVESVEFRPGDFLPINKYGSFQIIHIDDEVDKGWDIVFPAIFGDKYICASTPEKGMVEIEKYAHSSCVVLLDLRMPNQVGNKPDKETGLAALRKIREKWPLLPVYVFSANTDYESYGDALRAGASGYLVKYARSLETRSDSVLYRELWGAVRSARLANISHCIYSIFTAIKSHENFLKLPQRFRTKSAVLELAQALQTMNFDSLAKEDYQSMSYARYLIIILYKTLEHYVQPPGPANIDQYPISRSDFLIDIPRVLRNRAAHNDKIKSDKGRITHGIREVLLSASLLITKWGQLLQDEKWAKNQLDWLSSILLISTPGMSEVTKRIIDGNLYHSAEVSIGPIKNYLRRTEASDRHRLVEILAIDCVDSKNLDEGSYFNWFKADSLCRIEYASARLSDNSAASSTSPVAKSAQTKPEVVSHINNNTSPSARTWKKHQKTLDDLFELQDGQYFHRMQKYSGQAVNLSDPSQFDYLEWYYTKHIQANRDSYTKEVFVKFNEWLSNPDPKKIVLHEAPSDAVLSTPVSHFGEMNVLCLDITSLGVIDPREQITTLASKDNPSWIPIIKRGRIDSLYGSPSSFNGKIVIKGFRMGNPIRLANINILPVSPSVMHFNAPTKPVKEGWVFDGKKITKYSPDSVNTTDDLKVMVQGSHPSTMQDAKSAFDEVLQITKKHSLQISGPISWDKLGTPNQYPAVTLVSSANRSFSFENRKKLIRHSLDGIKLAIVNKTDQSDEVNTLKISLSGSVGDPAWVGEVEQSDAFIALVPKGLADKGIIKLLAELNQYEKPYVVVNPGSYKFKTYGIAFGLRTRLSSPLWSLSGRKPQRLFIGLDIGTRQGSESILAASCIDHTGRLRAWCRVSNPGHGTGPERIHPNTFQKAISIMWDKLASELDHGADTYNLVIHRDGDTLEDEQEFISILQDIGFTNSIEWVDIIKNSAPIISGNTSKSGLHLHINNNKDIEQYWNMQSVQDANKYIRPLVVEKREGYSSLSDLAAEVFYLSQVATHDYLGRQKLPATTYYADGFSKSGSEFLRFAGYEHLRAY